MITVENKDDSFRFHVDIDGDLLRDTDIDIEDLYFKFCDELWNGINRFQETIRNDTRPKEPV